MIDLAEIKEEQIEEYINNRINELEAGAKKTFEIGNVERFSADASHHQGFISKDTKVCYSNSQGYYIRNNDYLKEFIQYVKSNNLKPSAKTISKFLDLYFGEYQEISYRNERDFEEITDFKHSGKAMCTERAALANNILAFIGVQSWFCDGAVYNYKNMLGCHAFVIVKRTSGKYVIFDPTYSIYYDKEYHPYLKEISEEDAIRLLNADPLEPSKDNCLKVQDYCVKNVNGVKIIKNINSYRMYGVGIEDYELKEIAEAKEEKETEEME